jgi:hypothetical protein
MLSVPKTTTRRAFLAGVAIAGAASPIAASAAAAMLAPAIEALPSVPAASAAGPNPDTALMQMVEDFIATHKECKRWSRVRKREYKKHEARHPMPEVLNVRPEDVELDIPDARDSLERAQERARQYPDDPRYRDPYYFGNAVDQMRSPTWRMAKAETTGAADEGETSVRYWRLQPSPAARARADEIVAAYDEWKPRFDRLPRAYSDAERKTDVPFNREQRLQRKIARTPARTLAGLAAKVKVFALTMAEDADNAETMRMVASSFMRDVVALEKIA